jgi:hypothetical protein
VEVRDWMKNQSNTDFDNLLGMDESLADPKNITAESLLELESMQIPETFDSATKVPACAETIQRIHNQGTCGSCWAFGTLQAMDGRLCISTNGAFSGPKAALSRGYATSCATPGGRNGCSGGWFSFVYNIMGEGTSCARGGGGCRGSPGIPTGLDNGCIPYFGHGSGVDHFNSKSSAPPCSTSCVKTYGHRALKQDLYVAPGGGSWATNAAEFSGIYWANFRTLLVFSLGGSGPQTPPDSRPSASLVFLKEIIYKSGMPEADYLGLVGGASQ